MVDKNCPGQPFPMTESKKWKNKMMVLKDVGLEPEILQHQEFLEKSCGGQFTNHFQPKIVRKRRAGQLFPMPPQKILWKTINSWKTLARPMFSMNFHEKQWKTLARPMFSMNSLNFIDSWLVPGDSLENHKFMENIGQANVFHKFIEFHRFLAGPRRDSLENHKNL